MPVFNIIRVINFSWQNLNLSLLLLFFHFCKSFRLEKLRLDTRTSALRSAEAEELTWCMVGRRLPEAHRARSPPAAGTAPPRPRRTAAPASGGCGYLRETPGPRRSLSRSSTPPTLSPGRLLGERRTGWSEAGLWARTGWGGVGGTEATRDREQMNQTETRTHR